MNLESPKVKVEKSAEYIFDALSDIKNFEKLMPDNITKFEVTAEDSFTFSLKGMPEIKLKMKDKTPFSKIVFGTASNNFPFTLTGNISSLSENNSEVQLHFEGEFNTMMSIMMKDPISKFIETLATNVNKL